MQQSIISSVASINIMLFEFFGNYTNFYLVEYIFLVYEQRCFLCDACLRHIITGVLHFMLSAISLSHLKHNTQHKQNNLLHSSDQKR